MTNHKHFEDTCKSTLTEREYLEHMIPHHQVAIDMSKVLIKQTKWVELQKNTQRSHLDTRNRN
jgi:uncharacterized protein (DUF305 family)